MATDQRSRASLLILAALGVVFGDIGTSPLYALRECFAGSHAIPVTTENVLGVLSIRRRLARGRRLQLEI